MGRTKIKALRGGAAGREAFFKRRQLKKERKQQEKLLQQQKQQQQQEEQEHKEQSTQPKKQSQKHKQSPQQQHVPSMVKPSPGQHPPSKQTNKKRVHDDTMQQQQQQQQQPKKAKHEEKTSTSRQDTTSKKQKHKTDTPSKKNKKQSKKNDIKDTTLPFTSPLSCMEWLLQGAHLTSTDTHLTSTSTSTYTPYTTSSLLKSFFETHWEQKPMVIKRGNSDYYKNFFTKQHFDEQVAKHQDSLTYGFNLNLCICKDGAKINMNPTIDEYNHISVPEGFNLCDKHTRNDEDEDENENDDDDVDEDVEKAAANRSDRSDSEEEDGDEDEDENEDEEHEHEHGPNCNHDDDHTHDNDASSTAPVCFSCIQSLYTQGCTIQALQPQQYAQTLTSLCTSMESFFGTLVGSNVYITPPQSQGLAPHWDDVDVFILQLEGSKTWSLYSPPLSLPRDYSNDLDPDTLPKPMMTVTLEAGDLLYFPRGTIHHARTSSVMSSHITLSTYQRYSYYHMLRAALPHALEHAFDHDEMYRKGLPIGYVEWSGTGVGKMLEATTPTTTSTKTPNNKNKNTVTDVFQEQKAMVASRQQFAQQIKTLVHKLADHIPLDIVADELASDYMQHRLPPNIPHTTSTPDIPPELMNDIANGEMDMDEVMRVMNQHIEPKRVYACGEPPMNGDAKIRLIDRSSIRLSILNAQQVAEMKKAEQEQNEDEDQDQDEEDQEDGDREDPLSGGCVLLTSSLHNTTQHHLDGRYNAPITSIKFPLSHTTALLQLFATNDDIRVANLQFPEMNAEEKKEAQYSLAMGLWGCQMIVVS